MMLRRLSVAVLVSSLCGSTSLAQEYQTPEGYRSIEGYITERLSVCIAGHRSYEATNQCAEALYDECIELAPHGRTTAGLSICGGTVSNVLDRAINDEWRRLKRTLASSKFQELLTAQRSWLNYRETEAKAAAQRYSGGSMGAYSGWVRYNSMTSERLARLREMR